MNIVEQCRQQLAKHKPVRAEKRPHHELRFVPSPLEELKRLMSELPSSSRSLWHHVLNIPILGYFLQWGVSVLRLPAQLNKIRKEVQRLEYELAESRLQYQKALESLKEKGTK